MNKTETQSATTTASEITKEDIKQRQAQLKEELAALKAEEKKLKKVSTRKPSLRPIVEAILKDAPNTTLDGVFRKIIVSHPEYTVQTVVSSGRKAFMAITQPDAE